MAFGGGRFWRYSLWIFKKKVQVLTRTHLSHVFAIVLSCLVIVRENQELEKFFTHWPPSPVGLLIVVLVAGTMASAIWEFFGNKLTTSPQEIRFLQGIRSLLLELEKFSYGKDRIEDPSARLKQFLEGFLEIACNTLCGKCGIDGALMVKRGQQNSLRLVKSSKRARYPQELEIPLPSEGDTGPAGWAFDQVRITYLPNKKRHEAFPFELITKGNEEWYEPSEPRPGWVSAPTKQEENFRSVLCIPLAVYEAKGQKRRIGVLNFSTSSHDPFVDRDFMMGECFASILGQAFAVATRDLHAARASGKKS